MMSNALLLTTFRVFKKGPAPLHPPQKRVKGNPQFSAWFSSPRSISIQCAKDSDFDCRNEGVLFAVLAGGDRVGDVGARVWDGDGGRGFEHRPRYGFRPQPDARLRHVGEKGTCVLCGRRNPQYNEENSARQNPCQLQQIDRVAHKRLTSCARLQVRNTAKHGAFVCA